jgi:hypothetical protein
MAGGGRLVSFFWRTRGQRPLHLFFAGRVSGTEIQLDTTEAGPTAMFLFSSGGNLFWTCNCEIESVTRLLHQTGRRTSLRCMRQSQDRLAGPIECNYERRVQGRYVRFETLSLRSCNHAIPLLCILQKNPPIRLLGR